MGTFRFELQAVGGHGCERDASGVGLNEVVGCGHMDCPDCILAEAVAKLQRAGCSFDTMYGGASPKLTHWPGTEGEIVDVFQIGHPPKSRAARKRSKAFGGRGP